MKDLVRLVPFNLDDPDHVSWMFEVRSHPSIAPFFFAPPPRYLHDHIEFLKKSTTTRERQFFITCVEQDVQEAGLEVQKCGYCQIVHHLDSYEIGFALHPNWWGKGIGKASAELLLTHIRLHCDPSKRIILFVRFSNQRAFYLYRKMGFSIVEEDRPNDRCLMAILN